MDVVQQALVLQRQPREVDEGDVEPAQGVDPGVAQGAQGGAHHPTVDGGHDAVALGGADHLAGLRGLAAAVVDPQQHLELETPRRPRPRRVTRASPPSAS